MLQRQPSSSSSSSLYHRLITIALVVVGALCWTHHQVVESFPLVTPTTSLSVRTNTISLYMVRRGKGSIGKEVGIEGGMGMGGDESSSSATSTGSINWTPIAVSVKALPTEENLVTLIDTNLVTMKNSQTNPTGAVSVIQYKKQKYCFGVNCPSCQIPLIKAKCVPGNEESNQQPILQCDLCKASYNIQTGEKITSTANVGEKPGILGGIVKSIFSSKSSGPLKVYKLAEKNGKLLIAGLD